MKWNVEVLKKMIEVETMNIKMFQGYQRDGICDRLAQMVAQRRWLAALIENDGVEDDNFQSRENGWVGRIDYMAYSAAQGADTSWWTRGT